MVAAWKGVEDSQAAATTVNNVSVGDMETVKGKLAAIRAAFCVQRKLGEDQFMQYYTCQTFTGVSLVVEVKYKTGLNMCKVTVKSNTPALSNLTKSAVAAALA